MLALEDFATNGLAILTNPSRRIMATMTPRRHYADVKAKGVHVVVCEPTLDEQEFFGSQVTHDLEAFMAGCDVIVANRWSEELADVADKVYTRDLFKRD